MKIFISENLKERLVHFFVIAVLLTVCFLVGVYTPFKWFADSSMPADITGVYKTIALGLANGTPIMVVVFILLGAGHSLFVYLSENIKIRR